MGRKIRLYPEEDGFISFIWLIFILIPIISMFPYDSFDKVLALIVLGVFVVTYRNCLFNCKTAYEMARKMQLAVHEKTKIYTKVGIGSNPFLAKVTLDIEAKKNKDFIAEWRYKDVPIKLWGIKNMTDVCGIGHKTAVRLEKMGIRSIKELATTDYYKLKDRLGIIGTQLHAHANGIDRSFLGNMQAPKDKSIGNSQVLPKVYTRQSEIELVLKEIVDQVASRSLKQKNTSPLG
ncbi:DNA polymerase thumb domain-containing protein [Enterococcus rivorum]|uniref:DNA polymerase IV/DNA polymerase iota-like thumb domain-containing protein n=1 Tax=Enterococcus rivorum TaxID=762845 RepID=A0A1E5KYR6_9ENTE|nr:hypothetical protein [Enterococcus rivorum]MBP2099960.1 nucleotidyltransferase/DNA polymerase involved in DNA repair [Enterococcus rivorum]OEH82829.1 hypothetical protein BCR26_11415 [Enterococcus rivorum]